MKGLALTGWLLFAATAGLLYMHVAGVRGIERGPHFHGRKVR